MIGTPQLAASNRRTEGDQPAATMSARVTFKREALRGVEGRVRRRRQMLEPLDVARASAMSSG